MKLSPRANSAPLWAAAARQAVAASLLSAALLVGGPAVVQARRACLGRYLRVLPAAFDGVDVEEEWNLAEPRRGARVVRELLLPPRVRAGLKVQHTRRLQWQLELDAWRGHGAGSVAQDRVVGCARDRGAYP